jgi:hypothetical protein
MNVYWPPCPTYHVAAGFPVHEQRSTNKLLRTSLASTAQDRPAHKLARLLRRAKRVVFVP